MKSAASDNAITIARPAKYARVARSVIRCLGEYALPFRERDLRREARLVQRSAAPPHLFRFVAMRRQMADGVHQRLGIARLDHKAAIAPDDRSPDLAVARADED